MAKLWIFLIIFFLWLLCCSAQPPCSTYAFSNNKVFSSCADLPVLNSSLHWNYHQSSNRIDVAFRHTGATDRRWIAWAINPTSRGMIGAQAIVAFSKTDGTLATYTSPITSYGTQLEQGNLSFPVDDVSATYQNYEMIIFASVGLVGNSTNVNHLWQVGPLSENTPLMHSVAPSSPNIRSMGSLDFLSGRITATRGSTSALKIVHGVLNAAGWGILLPIGGIIARFKPGDPSWFYWHVGCQLSGSIIGVVGGGSTAFLLAQKSGRFEVSSHSIIGIALGFALTQVLVGFMRPKKDSKNRIYFNRFHYLLGYSIIGLGISNIFLGFRKLQAEISWMIAYACVIVVLVLCFCIGVLMKKCRGRRTSDDLEKNMPTGQGVSAVES